MRAKFYYILCIVLLISFISAEDLLDLDLEELRNVEIDTAATLTKTDIRRSPAAITRITQKMIKRSGARSLEELLEIFVPNYQVLRHHFAGTNSGFRGTLSDLNDKTLLLVNGRVMNHRSFYGADSEFKLSMLGDIHHIDVIRGPGSSTYGPGAISGVISIHTFNSNNFEGSEVSFRQGFIEEFSTFEMKLGHRFDDNTGLFIYAGGDSYQGSDSGDSPIHFGTTVNGTAPNHNTGINFANDKEAFRDRPRLKLHMEYNVANLDLWVRYTRGGQIETGIREFIQKGEPEKYFAVGYEQLTLAAKYTKELTRELELQAMVSYDIYDRYRTRNYEADEADLNLREEKLNLRLQLNWTPSEAHAFAVGTEYTFDQFGREPDGYPHEDAKPLPNNESWDSRTWALFAEHQWRLHRDLTSFTGVRADKHSYAELTFSPRQAFVYTPTDKDTLKLIYNRSVRRTSDFFLRTEYVNTRSESDQTETMDNYELRYLRQASENLTLGLSGFYSMLDILGFDGGAQANVPLGDLSLYGFEFEAEYESDKFKVLLSHAWTQMHDFDLENDSVTTPVTSASAYGYGDDLAHWSNHISKLYGEYYINKKWTATSSLIYYWAYPGAEDYADYNNDVLKVDNITRTEGSDKAFGSSIFVNLGLEYQHSEKLRLQMNAHNILGWLNDDYNKRNHMFLMDTYRSEAAALSFTIEYKF
jgi:outer membrane receptor for ferrienterochelin and colicins